MSVFIIGDIMFLHEDVKLFYLLGILFLLIGKLIYAARFSNYSDFKILKLTPFFILTFAYMMTLMMVVYDNLGDFLIPSFVYLFASLIYLLFGFLRYGAVNKLSFVLVTIGLFCTILCDTYGFLNDFYTPLPYEKYVIMFFYSCSHFFIILGLAKEKTVSQDYYI